MGQKQDRTLPDTAPRNRLASGDEVYANAPKTAAVGGPDRDNPADAWTGQYPPHDRARSADKPSEPADRQGPVCCEGGAFI